MRSNNTTHTITLEDQERLGGGNPIPTPAERVSVYAINLNQIDYSQTCQWRKRGSHKRFSRCDCYVVAGTHFCRTHQPKHSIVNYPID